MIGRVDIVRLIKAHKIEEAIKAINENETLNINERDLFSAKHTLLEEACMIGSYELVKALLDKGAEINAKNPKDGSYPLHYVVDDGIYEHTKQSIEERIKILALFHEKGANFNSTDGLNCTAVHLAILKKKFLYLESLITYGTDINAKDRESKTALDYAEENRHLKEILERIGATSGTKNVPFSNRVQHSFLGNHQFTLFLTEGQYDFHRNLQTGRLTPIPLTVLNNRHEAEEITSVPGQNQSIWTTEISLSSSVHKKPKPSNKHLMTSLINALRKNNEKLFIIFLRQASLLDLQKLQEIKKDIQEPFLSYIHTRLKEFEPPIASLDV